MKKWASLCLIDLILTLADGLFTYKNTPDLAMEGNFLAASLHLGWNSLILVNGVVFALFVVVTYYAFVKYKTVVADVRNLREYISLLMYNRPDKFLWSLYKPPVNWKPFLAVLGYAIGYSLILERLIVVSMWAAITWKLDLTFLNGFIHLIPFGRIDLAFILLALNALVVLWFAGEYKKSKKRHIPAGEVFYPAVLPGKS